MIRIHIVPALGFNRLDELRSRDVKRMVGEMQAKKLSASTIRNAHAVLRSALSEAERMEYVDRNVAKRVRLPPIKKRKPVILTLPQLNDFFSAIQDHRLQPLYVIALSLGLRRKEIIELRWANINLEQGSLTTMEEGKSENSYRTLPLPRFLVDVLKKHHQRQEIERRLLGDDWHEQGRVFPSEVGTAISGRNLLRHFKSVLKKAGLPLRMHFHDLRHNSATFLVAEDVHPRVVMQILGHSQIGITMNLYAHVLDAKQREALEKVGLRLSEVLQIEKKEQYDDEDEWDEEEDDEWDEEEDEEEDEDDNESEGENDD
jgi:integrase